MISIYDLNFTDLAALLAGWGEPSYRARQVWGWVYRRLVPAPEAMTDLPARLRERLGTVLESGRLKKVAGVRSNDGGTEKLLFGLADGQQIEAVLMRTRKRRTACISTQVGCAMGCAFCATGQMGFRRHLQTGEIVEQVLYFARRLREEDDRLSNVVVMGMGEPFHNYDATIEAVDRLNDPDGFNFGARRITLSTVGLVPMIERFAREHRQVNLAVSLHAATDELRSRLLPINKKYPLARLMEACRLYQRETHRRVTFECALIQDVNDNPEQARALLSLTHGLLCHVNLIPLNPTRDYAGKASTHQRVRAYKKILDAGGISCTIRVRRGIDINAGCGQLANGDVAATS